MLVAVARPIGVRLIVDAIAVVATLLAVLLIELVRAVVEVLAT